MSERKRLADLLFRFRYLPASIRRFRLWILLGLFVLVLLALGPILGPVVELVASAIKGIGRILEPILNNKFGRFLLVNLIVLAIVLIFYRRFKARGRRLVGAWALDRFLSGMLHLSAGRYRRAARAFEQVVRVGRLVNLREAVDAYPRILPDARIKLALCYRELGEIEKAMKSLELLKVRDLPPSMKLELAEAKAFVYAMSDDLMEETIDREIANAIEHDSSNRRLLRLRRDRAKKVGDLSVAIDAQKRILKGLTGAARTEERSELAALHARRAFRMFRTGDADAAMAEISKSRSHDPSLVLPNLLAGDIAAERGDPRAAVREWARTPSLPSLERIEGLLAASEISKKDELAALVEEFPRAGILLVLGEHYLRSGKLRRARNCVRKYEEQGLGNRHSAHLLARILREQGDEAGARREEWRALKGFLGADGRRTETD